MLKSFENCPGNQPLKFYVNLSRSAGLVNHLQFSGNMDVEREIYGPLEVVVELNRCENGMKKCEKFPTQKFTKVCHMLQDKNSLFAGIVNKMQPPISCPLKAQHYEAANSSVDMTTLSYLPLSGSIFVSNTKMFAGEGKRAEMVLCLSGEIKIVRIRKEKKATRNFLK